MSKRRRWSKVVEVHGVRVRLFERNGTIYRDVTLGRTVSANGKARTEHDVKSLKHGDRELAQEQAEALAARIAEARLTGKRTTRLTMGQVFDQYRLHKLPNLSDGWRRASETRIDLFTRAWGRDLEAVNVDQTRIDAFVRRRRAGELLPATLASVDRPRGYRTPRPVRDGTIDADLRWLSSVFNFARRHRVGGRRLMSENPLHDVSWPKERNPRRPVASHDRFVATMKHVDAVDPEGRLRCVLALARWTGRRESAICGLWASDLLLSPERVQGALAAEGMDERIADHMPHGAIRWRAARDKGGYTFVSPLSSRARDELDRYIRRSPRVGDVPLFPAPKDEAESVTKRLASRWLVKAEALAELPKLEGGIFHPYRRLYAVERKHLPDADVAASGGWRDTRALKLSYQQPDPETLLRVVEHA